MKNTNLSKILLGTAIVTTAVAGIGYIIKKSKDKKKDKPIMLEIPFSDNPLTTEEMLDIES